MELVKLIVSNTKTFQGYTFCLKIDIIISVYINNNSWYLTAEIFQHQ